MTWPVDLRGVARVSERDTVRTKRSTLNFSGEHASDDAVEKRTTVRVKSVERSIVASTTQTQGDAPLTSEVNVITVCDNVDDSVTLPAAYIGRFVCVFNAGAQSLQVFAAAGDAFDTCTQPSSAAVNSDAGAVWLCIDAATWKWVVGTEQYIPF